jgi:3',5'-cyclic-AMP phosphodiesterase
MNRNDHGGNSPPAITRRRLLKCSAWAGAGVVLAMKGGVLRSFAIGDTAAAAEPNDFAFVQVSDSHIGFTKVANPDTVGTLTAAIGKIRALPTPPAFILHTGDVSHLSKDEEFDTARQVMQGSGLDVHYVPGEHDVLGDGGRAFFARFNQDAQRKWYSFDHGGVHFVGLVNVLDLVPGGRGRLGTEQLKWLADDLRGRTRSTPIIVFAHMPLWDAYPQWGWGTDDAAEALGQLRQFGSVTVLNGHVHQVLQKVEGHVTFHTARSTAFPQPAPGMAPAPGPMQVPAGQLRGVLGIREVAIVQGSGSLAVVDQTLA